MNQKRTVSACLLLFPMFFAACGDPDPQGSTSSGSTGDTGGMAGQAGMGGSGGAGGNMGGAGGAGGNGGAGGAAGAGGGSNGLVPATSAELFPWLQAKSYAGFAAESAVHVSTTAHGQNVRTFVNPILFDALSAGSTNFPVGAAAVKELWGNGTKLLGWAVTVKTQANSAGGSGIYWYEIYNTTDPSNPVADGNGVGLCSGCHSSGIDYFRSPFPLK